MNAEEIKADILSQFKKNSIIEPDKIQVITRGENTFSAHLVYKDHHIIEKNVWIKPDGIYYHAGFFVLGEGEPVECKNFAEAKEKAWDEIQVMAVGR